MPSFMIVKVLEDGTEEKMIGYPDFTSGKDAKHYAEQLQQMNPGVKYQPRPIKSANTSHKQAGLTAIPHWDSWQVWSNCERKTNFIDPMYDAKQMVVRYFATAEAKSIGKSVSMELQTFLAKFFIHDDEQSMWTIAIDPDWFDKNYIFGIARTEEEILDVYSSGLDSCMTKRSGYYVEGENPVRVYATDDFGVAWLKDRGTDRLKARSIVSPPRNIFGRIYGNDKVMRHFLNKNGYYKGFGDDWVGLKFPTKWIEGSYIDGEQGDYDDDDDHDREHDKGYQAPYIDNSQSFRVDEEGDKSIAVLDPDGDYRAYCTNGVAAQETDDRYFCDECEKGTRDYYHFDSDNTGLRRCYDCTKKRYGLDSCSRFPPDPYNYDRCWRQGVEHTADGYMVLVSNRYNYKKCSVTGDWLVVSELPTLFGERITPAEAKEKYNEYWPILENAFLSQTRKVADRGTLYQEVPAAA